MIRLNKMETNISLPNQVLSQGKVSSSRSFWLWLGPVLFGVCIGLYYVFRYEGRWSEYDTSLFGSIFHSLLQYGKLIPDDGNVYQNGFTFQAISVYIISITGLDIPTLQQIIYPLLCFLVVSPAWLLFREVTGSAKGAAIATLLLLTQPEFLFVLLRSSHEKFTRSLMLLALYLLIHTYKLSGKPRLLVNYVLLFYLVIFAFISSNNLISNSFIFAVALALVFGLALDKRLRWLSIPNHTLTSRLIYVLLISLGFVFIFSFYLYPPAKDNLSILKSIWSQIQAFFLDVNKQTYNPYNTVSESWISFPVYLMLSGANWIILVVSLLVWTRQGFQWLIRRVSPPSQMAWLLWLLYTAFAVQGGLSILSDASGAFGNLQVRLFPSFSIIAVGMLARTLESWEMVHFRNIFRASLSLLIIFFVVAAILKATNEPLLSNHWVYYQPSEIKALNWSFANLKDDEVWADYDERLVTAYNLLNFTVPNGNSFVINNMKPSTRVIMQSSVILLRSERLGRVFPAPSDALQIYDNGEVKFYHLKPLTLYQK